MTGNPHFVDCCCEPCRIGRLTYGNTAEAAVRAETTVKTIQRWRERGLIQPVRILKGHGCIYRMADVVACERDTRNGTRRKRAA